MDKQTFINGGAAAMAGFVNSLSGSEGSNSVAAFVHAHQVARRPVTPQTVSWNDYQSLTTAILNYGPNTTTAELDTAIEAWDGT
jgi:hypothetical protein